jgi:hypothetical protein
MTHRSPSTIIPRIRQRRCSLGESWGATAAERAMPLACDELMPEAPVRVHRAVSVHAPPPVVFRWLCQLKVAPYSYDILDNLGRRSPRRLTPGVEQLEPGQRFMTVFRLALFERNHQLTLRNRRFAVTYALLPGARATRLVGRVLFDPPAGRFGAAVTRRAFALGDLVMMRKQLLTLKALAERDAPRAERPQPPIARRASDARRG